MMTALASGFASLLSVEMILLMLIGVVVGIIFGEIGRAHV